ncbi:MAG TPA: type II toxin-antitoxin system prevent-host-death family antitoxin [Gemmatimonadales bacterium]|jgi:prevent-host-death family protein
MRDTFSLYETKAKLSAIIRRVREGHRIVVTVHGEPVAEIRPVDPVPSGMAGRLAHLAERGILVRPEPGARRMRTVVRRRGALARFLAERDG